jgi:hypothetical protein
MNAPTASIASQVSDPHCGQTKVVATTGEAYCAPQPGPGLVIHNGQASVPPVIVPMPPPLLALLARLLTHIVGKRRWLRPLEEHIMLPNLALAL